MKGRFQQKHIENVLRRYIKEYVTCHTCRSPDTILNKETRLFFLQCMTCHSSCSVHHQNWFPGRHWKEKVTSGQNYLDISLGCLDHHPGHLVLLALLLPVSLCIYLASALVIFGVSVNTPPLQIVAIIIFP